MCGAQLKPVAPHTSDSLTSDLAAIGAINCHDTGTWRHIRRIVWKATERVSEGCPLSFPRMLNSQKECAIVRDEGCPAHLAARQTVHEHFGHPSLRTLDFDDVDGVVVLDSGWLTVGGDPQTAGIVEGNVIRA